MMKKLLFSAILFMAVATFASAQCTPGSYTSPGIYPDTVTNLPTAYVNLPYSATITAVIPTDTVVSGFPIPIDSIGISGWSGYPPGFTYTPNTASGCWAGGTSGCILISGTASLADTGVYHLKFFVGGYIMGSSTPMPDTAYGYKIVIKDSALGIAVNVSPEFTVMQNTPNPFMTSTKIEFTSSVPELLQFSVINVIGEEVYSQFVNAKAGENTIEFSAGKLPSGIYLYKLSNKETTITKRMIIEK